MSKRQRSESSDKMLKIQKISTDNKFKELVNVVQTKIELFKDKTIIYRNIAASNEEVEIFITPQKSSISALILLYPDIIKDILNIKPIVNYSRKEGDEPGDWDNLDYEKLLEDEPHTIYNKGRTYFCNEQKKMFTMPKYQKLKCLLVFWNRIGHNRIYNIINKNSTNRDANSLTKFLTVFEKITDTNYDGVIEYILNDLSTRDFDDSEDSATSSTNDDGKVKTPRAMINANKFLNLLKSETNIFYDEFIKDIKRTNKNFEFYTFRGILTAPNGSTNIDILKNELPISSSIALSTALEFAQDNNTIIRCEINSEYENDNINYYPIYINSFAKYSIQQEVLLIPTTDIKISIRCINDVKGIANIGNTEDCNYHDNTLTPCIKKTSKFNKICILGQVKEASMGGGKMHVDTTEAFVENLIKKIKGNKSKSISVVQSESFRKRLSDLRIIINDEKKNLNAIKKLSNSTQILRNLLK